MWDFHRITVSGDTVAVPDLPGQAGLEWFMRTILDGLIPVWAPIGIYLNPIAGNVDGDRDTRGRYSRMVVRNNSFAETPLEIVTNTYGMIMLGVRRTNGVCSLTALGDRGIRGEQDFATMPVISEGAPSTAIPVLSPKKHYCTITSKSTVDFFVSMQTGYRSMSDNARLLQTMRGYRPSIRDTKQTVGGIHFLSVASDHTLNNFLHVHAELVGGKIKVHYDNGMTPALLEQLWKEAEEFGDIQSA